MKLLVVSHACATPLNQSFFAEIEETTGWSLTLVLPASWKTEYSERQAERWPAYKGNFCPIPVWKSGNIPLHAYRTTFLPLLRREKPDAIYVQHEPYGLATAQVYLANRMSGNVPIGFYAAQNIFKNYPVPFRWTERMVLTQSRFCFPVTETALQVLRAKGYQGDAEVLPLAVDAAIYAPQPKRAEELRSSLGIGAAEPVIGYLGRLVEEKGLLTLMRALKTIQSRSWRCVLVGNGPFEPEVRATVDSLGLADRVIFAGYVPHTEAPAWLSLFNILALPSETRGNWKEQFGRVIIEANACGTPVVGTECGEIPVVIGHTGGGLVVPEADPLRFAGAISTLLDDPVSREEMGTRSAAVVREQYDQRYLVSRFVAAVRRQVDASA